MEILHFDRNVMAWRLILIPPKLISAVARMVISAVFCANSGARSMQPRVISTVPVSMPSVILLSMPKILRIKDSGILNKSRMWKLISTSISTEQSAI